MKPSAKLLAAAIHGVFGLLWAWLACAIVTGIFRDAKLKDWPYCVFALLIAALPGKAAWKAARRSRRIATGEEIVPVTGGSVAAIIIVGLFVALLLFFLYGMMRMDERRWL